MNKVVKIGDRFASNVSTIEYVVTAIIDDHFELKVDFDATIGLLVSTRELKNKFRVIECPYEVNFLR